MGSRKRVVVVVTVAAVVAAAGIAFLIRDDGPAQSATDFRSPPYTRGIEVGRTYNFSLYLHCGLYGAGIDGTSWRATPPMGNAGPPEGWPERTVGRLTIIDEDTAIFDAGRGREARFVRDADMPTRYCG